MKGLILIIFLLFSGCGMSDFNIDKNTTTKITMEANKTIAKLKDISTEDIKRKAKETSENMQIYLKEKALKIKALAKEEFDKSWEEAKKEAAKKEGL
jgi:preprotein translocase subunit SecF